MAKIAFIMNEQAMTLARVNQGQRLFLVAAMTLIGGTGVVAVAVPFISAMS